MAPANDTQGAEAGALKRGANEVHNTFDNLQGKLADVDRALGNITSHWSGAAFLAFQGLLTSWGDDVKTLNKILIDLEDALGGAESDRVAMEDQAQDTIKGLQGLMGAPAGASIA